MQPKSSKLKILDFFSIEPFLLQLRYCLIISAYLVPTLSFTKIFIRRALFLLQPHYCQLMSLYLAPTLSSTKPSPAEPFLLQLTIVSYGLKVKTSFQFYNDYFTFFLPLIYFLSYYVTDF